VGLKQCLAKVADTARAKDIDCQVSMVANDGLRDWRLPELCCGMQSRQTGQDNLQASAVKMGPSLTAEK